MLLAEYQGFLQQKLHTWLTYEIKVNLDKIIWQSDSSENIAYLRLLIFTLKSLPAPHNIQAVLYTLWATTEFAMMFVCLQSNIFEIINTNTNKYENTSSLANS